MHIVVKNKFLYFRHYKVKCAIGKRGIDVKKKEGDLITPKGTYKIKRILYRKDRLKKLRSKLKKMIITKKMGWCDDAKSKQYNRLIKLPFNYSHEKIWRNDNIYDIILVLDFNMSPVRKNKGSAIFLHVAKKTFTPTKGCIAIRKKVLKRIVSEINKKTKIVIS